MADTYGVEMIDSNNNKQQEDHTLIIVLHCSLYCSWWKFLFLNIIVYMHKNVC
jgi:hypothetical protein